MEQTVKKIDVLKEIKDTYKKENSEVPQLIKLPGEIDFVSPDKSDCDIVIEMGKTGILNNMQSDNASFEGWCFVLRRWTNTYRKIRIKWYEPTTIKSLHYQRFLYRIFCMQKRYDWFSISEYSYKSMEKSLIFSQNGDLVINAPAKNCTMQNDVNEYSPTMSEVKLEAHLYANPEKLKKILGLDSLYRQFPVGVFNTVKSNNNAIFPHKGAAIDLWGINRKYNKLHIIELKNSSNLKVGAISELIFYANIMQDLIKKNPVFKQSKSESYFTDRGTESDLKNIPNMESLAAYILAPALHRLIDNKLIEDINNLNILEGEKQMSFGLLKLHRSYDVKMI